jgi:hypothetical protein
MEAPGRCRTTWRTTENTEPTETDRTRDASLGFDAAGRRPARLGVTPAETNPRDLAAGFVSAGVTPNRAAAAPRRRASKPSAGCLCAAPCALWFQSSLVLTRANQAVAFYSPRSAVTGSTAAARRAGSQQAAAPAASQTAAAPR